MREKTKVLFIFQLPPPVHGASLMNKLIFDSELVNNNSSFEPIFINFTTAKDIRDIGKKGMKKYFNAFVIYYKIIKILFKHKIALSYITLSPHGVAFYKDALIIVILKFFRIKRVIHMHGKGISNIIKHSQVKKKMYLYVFKKAKVIHLSDKLYYDIKNIVKKTDVSFLPNGIAQKGMSFDKPINNTILYLSNLQESKGSFDLLQAAKILKDEGVDFKINFVGKWHSDPLFKEKFSSYYEKHNLKEHVFYLGPKYDKDKFIQFGEATIFVLPTFYKNECFPISVLEAMSQKLVVVATDEGAITDMIIDGKNGIIVKKNNPVSIANALKDLLNNKSKIEAYRSTAFNDFNLKFSKEIFERNFFNTIKSFL